MITLLSDEEENMFLSPYDLLSLEKAGISGGAFAMRPLNPLHLERLAQSDPELDWPPILVTRSDKGYIVIDGNHRWDVAKQKVSRLRATCKAYTSEKEVIQAAFEANLTHGLTASVQTRGDFAFWLSKTFPEMRQEEIAQKTGLSQGAVSKAIAKRAALAKRALQDHHQQEESAKERQKALQRSCRRFARDVLAFLQDMGDLADEELAQVLSTQVKTPEDRQRLARMGRLFTPENTPVNGPPATGPLRVRPFAPKETGALASGS